MTDHRSLDAGKAHAEIPALLHHEHLIKETWSQMPGNGAPTARERAIPRDTPTTPEMRHALPALHLTDSSSSVAGNAAKEDFWTGTLKSLGDTSTRLWNDMTKGQQNILDLSLGGPQFRGGFELGKRAAEALGKHHETKPETESEPKRPKNLSLYK